MCISIQGSFRIICTKLGKCNPKNLHLDWEYRIISVEGDWLTIQYDSPGSRYHGDLIHRDVDIRPLWNF